MSHVLKRLEYFLCLVIYLCDRLPTTRVLFVREKGICWISSISALDIADLIMNSYTLLDQADEGSFFFLAAFT